MAITTYAELKTAISNWLDRTDLTSYTGDFIALAEADINDRVRIRSMVKRAQATSGTSSRYIALPSGVCGLDRVHAEVGGELEEIDTVHSEQILSSYSSTASTPEYCALTGGEIEFNRLFDQARTLEVLYFKKFTALSDSNTSNDLLTEYPNIYLYGALSQAELFLIDDQRVSMWKALYDEGVYKANESYKKNKGRTKKRLKTELSQFVNTTYNINRDN